MSKFPKEFYMEGKCSTVVTVDELLEKYRRAEIPERDKGTKFERLMKNFLLTNPVYRGKFSDVWLWNEFSFRDELGTVDLGIDIVCKAVDGDFWAVQCKFYAETTIIDMPAIATFLATSGKTFDGDKKFSARLWISTSNNLTDNAEITVQNQSPPVARIGMEELRKAAVDWEKLDAGTFGKDAVNNFREPLPHQLDAINAAQNHFQNHNCGKLIMACGTGKTYTSLKIAEKLYPDGKILFLVPSISLLGQILYEWATYSEKPFNYICVCSDKTVSKKTDDEILSVNLPLPATTDHDEISRRMENFCADNMTVIFSTYQSLDKVAAAKISFDLIICDEAHRTTGYGTEATAFTQVHDENFISGKKRLYMTATPRLYTSDANKKAADKDLLLWSMDDEKIYGGEEFYNISFSEAVKKNLLSDYKVIVFTVNGKVSSDKKSSGDDLPKIKGCINALSKKMVDVSEELAKVDPAPMHTAVVFCKKINDSIAIKDIFNAIAEENKNILNLESRHVDGTQLSKIRNENLRWLKEAPNTGNECRILTNVRCLSEGIDVPALDAVIFMSSKKSKVDIVQAVGRVMRKARDKKYGYIIIPVVVPLDKKPEDVLSKSKTYNVIWDVLNAMRAHDRRIDIFIEDIKLKLANGKNPADDDGHIIICRGDDDIQINLDFGDWQEFFYARMVEHVGDRRYWEQWAKDIAQIAERHVSQIKNLIATDNAAQRNFGNFVFNLRQNLNITVDNAAAIEMLAQHIITRPVFEALFENYSFAKNNPISKSLENILLQLDIKDTTEDSAQLQKFYDSVRERCQIATTAEDKQKIIIELYEKFFKIATPKTVERLGIVYTPVEVVDFILRSVNEVLKKNFGKTLSSRGVHVLDPFTGTGTFITRLIQSSLIKPRDMFRKYFRELHANEIVLLAYYIAAINIENAFHNAVDAKSYQPFEGICFTDTFQAYEQDEDARGQTDFKAFREPMKENSERVKEQIKTRIEVIVGNPPYSVGQTSANDNNQNTYYGKIEDRIAATYAKGANAQSVKSLYDSYIKAFRWAADRIKDGGVIGFVTNANWIDKDANRGMRDCFVKEFSEIYVFNLRGDIRNKEKSDQKKDGENVFDIQTGVAITILVKNPEHVGDAKIFYAQTDDYQTREKKLELLTRTPNVLNDFFKPLTPNDKGDWINQRGDEFDTFIPLAPDKKFDGKAHSFFVVNSLGLNTNRDAWVYNFSRTALETNMQTTIDYYNTHEPTDVDPTKFVWTSSAVDNKSRKREYTFDAAQIVEGMYRPFCKLNLYFGAGMIHRRGQMDALFPHDEENLLICVTGSSARKNFSVLIVDKIPCLDMVEKAQCFPLYWYEEAAQGNLFGEELTRRDGVTDFIWNRAKLLYGGDVTREDIFYYVYGFLHLPAYREKFSAELKKSLPRIILTPDAKKFWQLSRAGRNLAEIHLNYETQPAPDGVEVEIRAEDYRVKKMRLSKDKTTLKYNRDITIKNILPRSFEYVVNGRSPLEWIIDRYQIKTDSASGIVNNPNDWAIEHDNPRYILDLILSSITVSLKTLDIVYGLPTIEF